MKRQLKGFFVLFLVAALILSGTACSSKSKNDGKNSSGEKTSSNETITSEGSSDSDLTGTSSDSQASSSGDQIDTSGNGTSYVLAPKTKNPSRPWEKWTSSDEDNTPSGKVESSTHSMLQTYIYSPTAPIYQSKKEFLPSVGYYPDGNLNAAPTDTMFDTFIFLSSPGHHHGGGNGKYGGVRMMTKTNCEDYYNSLFKTSVNLDALNAATGEVKEVLKRPNYKVNVFLPYFNCHPDLMSFGNVNGENLNFSKEKDRFAGVKWQIDEQIRRFEAKKYKHIQIAGFFYVTEGLMSDYDEASKINPTIIYANTYASSLGYESLWNPFNSWTTGYTRWNELKFTRSTMQINYFPRLLSGDYQLNTQPKEQIESAGKRTGQYGLGITLEWSVLSQGIDHKNTEYDGVKYFKEYMEGGVLYNYMNRAFCNYQLDGGPNSIYYDCLKSESPYVRSLYPELYKYIKCELTTDSINWF